MDDERLKQLGGGGYWKELQKLSTPEPMPGRQNKEKELRFLNSFSVVDYTGKFSNFFEDLLRLDWFAQSVEDELNRNVVTEEGSRKDP